MLISSSTQRKSKWTLRRLSGTALSAGALDARKPIEEPETDGAGDVKNHLADLDLDFTIRSSCRCHHVSFF
jgi:hypothetical protein